MPRSINYEKHIREGWTVGMFVEELQPIADLIMSGGASTRPFATREQVKAWCMDNQPFYKKHIPDVVEHFCRRYHIA